MSHNSEASSDVLRFGYFIPHSNGTVDFHVSTKTIGPDVLAELKQITGVIWVVQPILIIFKVIEINFRELVESIDLHRSKLNAIASPMAVSVSLHMEGSVDAVQRITNLLSSASAFLAQTKKIMDCAVSQSTLKNNDWDEKRKSKYASSFAFRFLYSLRNYSQHYGLPISGLSVAGESANGKENMIFNVEIMIDRNKLLETSYQWKKLKKEIQQQPPEFNLIPLADEYYVILRELCLEAVRFYKDQLNECDQYFKKLRKILKIPYGAAPVIFVGETVSGKMPPPIYQGLPFENLEWIINMLYELNRYK